MRVTKISRKESGIFSEQHVRLVDGQKDALSFLQVPFSKNAYADQITLKERAYSDESRAILVNALVNQYGSQASQETLKSIEILKKSNTFTVTTGHQLTLLTGPFYFVLKIMQVIKMAEELRREYPNQSFVPVFWMASEDHDFEEVQTTDLFNNKLTFDYQQRGPVGRFHLDRFDGFKREVFEFFGEDRRNEVESLLNAYTGKNLAEATRNLVNHLFGERGLLIVNGDDRDLKRLFIPTIKRELFEGKSEAAVLKTNALLEQEDWKIQVHPRPINLFYIEDGIRERIVRTDNGFEAGEKFAWSETEIEALIESTPEAFSPNVILRPVYQEAVLPNLSYTGGAGEISYWIQLKGVFELYGVPYPLIQVRNSFLWIDKTTLKKIEKLGLNWTDVFMETEQLKKDYLVRNATNELDFSELNLRRDALISEIEKRALEADSNLKQFVEAEGKRLENQIDAVKAKLIKVSKGKHDAAMTTIEAIKERLFPGGGGLQERSTNFLSFCSDGLIQSRLEFVYTAIEPFGVDLIVVHEVEST